VPRHKLSEFRAKTIVNNLLNQKYQGWSIVSGVTTVKTYGKTTRFVVKVDQAVKQRFKKGLVFLNVAKSEVPEKVKDLQNLGYDSILVEPYVEHNGERERYLSFRREREGVIFSYSNMGGVDIEAHSDSIQSNVFDEIVLESITQETGLSIKQLTGLRELFDRLHLTLLEINPYFVNGSNVSVLDVAMEVDSSAELLAKEWSVSDIRTPATTRTEEEENVRRLKAESSASFNLEVINPDGSIFLLLSGGGASVVIADEIFTLGYGKELANYGEYSGNPTEDETYRYASQVISLLLKSNAPKKVVLVGGAVANFTDISATFKGIISVLREYGADLSRQNVKFYVRRGGPKQEIGLKNIKKELKELNLIGGVYTPDTSIPTAVRSMLEGLK